MQGERLQKWALTAEIVGGAAVLITLIFLIFQISESVRATRAQTAQSLFDQLQNTTASISSSPELQREWVEFNQNGFTNLDFEQRARVTATLTRLLFVYDNAYYQYQQDTLDDIVFDRFRRNVLERTTRDYFPRYWEARKNAFTKPFQEWIDGFLQNVY